MDKRVTADEVRRRAARAGVSIDEDQVEEVAKYMELALAPLRRLDLRATRLVEPAATYDALGRGGGT